MKTDDSSDAVDKRRAAPVVSSGWVRPERVIMGCMIVRLALMSWLAISTAAAAPPSAAKNSGTRPSYYRADGRRVFLDAAAEGWTLVIRAPGEPRPILLEDQLIVRTEREGGLPDAALAGLDLRVVRPMRGLDYTWLLRAPDARSAVRACAELVEAGLVIWAVPDFVVPVQLHHQPDDPLYELQWHLEDQLGHDIAAEGAWDITTGDPQVIVAVIDTGVDMDHPDLDPTRMVAPRNEISDSDDSSPTSLAIDSHGTACMGLVAADMDNGLGVTGVCPSCGWMPVRVFGRGAIMNLSAISEGIAWAVDNGAWILSNSWGIGQELIDQGIDVVPVQDAVRYAVTNGRGGKGCVVLFASGNGDSDLNAQPIGPDELPAMEETIAVGGCDHLGVVAKYSDYGPCVSVVAPTWSGYPGEPRIATTDTSGDAGSNKQGENYRTDPDQNDFSTGWPEPDSAGDYTSRFTGTSAATPITAGVAALVLSVNPDLTWREVCDILRSTAGKVGQQAMDPRVQARYDEDGHDDHYGHGRVQAERAVAVALFGTDLPNGEECWLDLNCQGDCVIDPALEEGLVCARPCEIQEACDQGQVCLEGHCHREPDGGDDEVVITGGCGCGTDRPGESPWLVLMCSGCLLVAWRWVFLGKQSGV